MGGALLSIGRRNTGAAELEKIMETSKEGILYEVAETHISDIKGGDTVVHNGHLKTVSACNLTRDNFLGTMLFGDSYHGGRMLVKKADVYRALPNSAAA